MGYAIVGLLFFLAFLAALLLVGFRSQDPEADSLSLPEPGDTDADVRKKHLFSCYLAGNDAYPANYCPFEECTPEREQWVAGWMLAARGMMVDGRKRQPDNPSCRHPARQPIPD